MYFERPAEFADLTADFLRTHSPATSGANR
jgi:hypothetical protein